MQIGPYKLPNNLILAPMAGVTDRPFRQLCRTQGAGLAVSEMVSSNALLWGSRKTQRRIDHTGEDAPVSVQIAGADPAMMAEAARFNVDHGAQIIDINMGCPAKKVCNKLAGSALLSYPDQVRSILQAVVAAVDVPVTLKIRTGPSPTEKNGVEIATMAEQEGIAALAVHGRTRADRFKGEAEYETIRHICESVSIPVFANGDIESPEKACQVLDLTGADGLMIGRAAQGNPWIFREIKQFMDHGEAAAPPSAAEVHGVMTAHLRQLHRSYGEEHGVRVARKHICWYLEGRENAEPVRRKLMRARTAEDQFHLLNDYFGNRDLSREAA